jgi:hypothetical protein
MFQGFGYNDTQIKANMLRMEEMRAEAERLRPIDYSAEPPEPRRRPRFSIRLPRLTVVRRLTPTGPASA